MTNPINGISPGNIPASHSVGKNGASGKNTTAQSEKSGRTDDVVNLTNAAETLQDLEKSLATDAQISSEKVEAIKKALSAGDYQIDPERIAEKFLEVERALGKV